MQSRRGKDYNFRSEMDQSRDGEPELSARLAVNGVATAVTLTAAGELRWTEGGISQCLVVEKEVIGFSSEGSTIKITAVVETGDVYCCVGNGGAPLRKTFVLEPWSEDSLRLWCQKLQAYLDSLGRPKRLFIFVNPYGGKKSASNIFIDEVKPLLEDANVEFIMQETKYQLHAKEIAQTLDLSKYDGIICVSGDGILVEVVNGLLERVDWNAAIQMPLGVVPAGTGNGMAKSLLDLAGHPCSATNAVLAIIRGHKRALDVATILQGGTRFFSVLMLAWDSFRDSLRYLKLGFEKILAIQGLVADIDIESEKYRWMGSSRIDFYALQRIFHLRKYNGCISFVPAPGFETYGEPCSQNVEFMGNPSHDKPIEVQQCSYQGPNVDLQSLNWRKIDGPFISIWLHNVPWGGEKTKAAPDAKFSDGYLDLILMRNCPKLALLALMSGLNNGSHIKSPHVLYLKAKAFVLEPGPRTDNAGREGIIDVDGEVLARGKGTYQSDHKALMAYDKLQIAVDQGLATLFTPI